MTSNSNHLPSADLDPSQHFLEHIFVYLSISYSYLASGSASGYRIREIARQKIVISRIIELVVVLG